jgi:threonine/homoserine/homoserine lactone efflux protein
MLRYITLGVTFAFAAVVQPGPFQTFLISQSLAKGCRRALPAALAPLLSDAPIVLLVLFILTRIPVWFVPVLQLAGGIFLLYLAYGAYRSWQCFDLRLQSSQRDGNVSVIQAALVNLLNPNPYLAWSLVMGPLLIESWRASPSFGLALLSSFYLTMILGMGGIVALFSAARTLGPRICKGLVGVSVFALMGFGLFNLLSGMNGVWGIW